MVDAWAYRLEKRLLQPPWRLYFRSALRGGERVPREGPLLVASNHASFLDPWFLADRFPRGPVRYLINEEWYRRSRFFTWFFDAHGVLPARRGDPRTTVERVRRALERGDVVGVFPEGRISNDGLMNRLRHGIGWMAALSGAPVVPCGLRGNYVALPRHRKLPRRHPVELHVGEPLHFPGAPTAEPDPEEVQAFVERLAAALCELAGQAGREEQVRPGPPRALPDAGRATIDRSVPRDPRPRPG